MLPARASADTFREVTLDHLPLFPLPLVLFPGASVPLHIFEQRYRRLLDDCLEGDRGFGIIRLRENEAEESVAPGTVGCVAQILSTERLADGRSNIVVRGTRRFALQELLPSPAPYHVCRAEAYEDLQDTAAELEALAGHVRSVFLRVGKAARALADDPDPLPELPAEPALLSFAIAAMIDLDDDARQQLLASRSPLARLQQLGAVLGPALGTLGVRAQVHTLAKSNGRGVHVQP